MATSECQWAGCIPPHQGHYPDAANPPVNYPASENDVTHSRKRTLNIYKSLITGVNESFQPRSRGAQWEGSDLANRGKREKEGNNYEEGG